MTPKFNLGRVVATPAALAALEESGESPSLFLDRHSQGDWGNICDEGKALNDAALVDGSRLLSVYTTLKGVTIWVITEAVGDDGTRASSCLLLPQDYYTALPFVVPELHVGKPLQRGPWIVYPLFESQMRLFDDDALADIGVLSRKTSVLATKAGKSRPRVPFVSNNSTTPLLALPGTRIPKGQVLRTPVLVRLLGVDPKRHVCIGEQL
jgi:hypothetical protein